MIAAAHSDIVIDIEESPTVKTEVSHISHTKGGRGYFYSLFLFISNFCFTDQLMIIKYHNNFIIYEKISLFYFYCVGRGSS